MSALASNSRKIVLAILVVALTGMIVPYAVSNGIPDFRHTPIQYRVAMNALQDYWFLNRNSRLTVVAPNVRVTRVWSDPGHCNDPRVHDQTADYRAEVRRVGWFGIPGRVLDVSCGGRQWWWHRK